jgi:hypothetical protein
MKRKEPKECPKCKSKHFSYETDTIELVRDESGKDIIVHESEWTCGECDEIFYYRARYELGNFLNDHVYT